MKKLIGKVFEILGFEIRRKVVPGSSSEPRKLDYDYEDEAREAIRIVRHHTMVTYPSLVTLYQQAVFCETHGVGGSFVECGTWKGGAVGLMALANLKHGPALRHLHLFDSFEGIPEPDASVDGERALREVRSVGGGTTGKLMAVRGFYEKFADGVGTLETNRHLLEAIIGYDSAFVHYHQGWFQDTLMQVASGIGPIALLRLDGDFYASIKVCMEHLYDHVASGGFVVIDDYKLYEGCQKAVDEFMSSRRIRAYLNHIDATARYWIKP